MVDNDCSLIANHGELMVGPCLVDDGYWWLMGVDKGYYWLIYVQCGWGTVDTWDNCDEEGNQHWV